MSASLFMSMMNISSAFFSLKIDTAFKGSPKYLGLVNL